MKCPSCKCEWYYLKEVNNKVYVICRDCKHGRFATNKELDSFREMGVVIDG
jgi:hypothetical protein